MWGVDCCSAVCYGVLLVLVGYGVRGQDQDVYHRALQSLWSHSWNARGKPMEVHSSGRYDEGAGVEPCRLSN